MQRKGIEDRLGVTLLAVFILCIAALMIGGTYKVFTLWF